ncbi:response regulator [Pricia sp.]|uniref:response regulator n=1 Tax=Pricia sp. TaxID=2268138 RepID=UPI003593B3F6
MSENTLYIALADDDADDRLLFRNAMENLRINTELSIFNNGQELIDYLNSPNHRLPELIFLDLNMPVKTGMECLKEIRGDSIFSDITIAIYSTSSSERDIDETFISGANVYISKPNNFDKLKEAIAKVIEMNWQYHTSRLAKENFLLRI